MRIHEFVSRCVYALACSESMRKLDTYSVENEPWVLIDRGCYSDVATLTDNYRLVDNNY